MSSEQWLVVLKIAIALLAIMATYSLAGLIAVWGVQGRGHWFLRMAAVLAFPAVWLLTSDRRLCLFFLVQMAVVVLRLWHLESRRPTSDARAGLDTTGPTASGSPASESRRRYSLAELLLVFVLLSGVLAMLARMPPQVRWDWHFDVLPGFAMGMFTLFAVWAAQSQRSAWLRAAALLLAFPSLLMGGWLCLARSARWPIGRAAAWLSLLLFAVPPAMIYVEELQYQLYPPPLADNGYVDLLRATEMIDEPSAKVEALSGDELRAYLLKQRPALELAQRGLARPCQAVLYDRMDDMRLIAEGQQLEKLSQIFAARGRQELQGGRLQDAVESYFADIEFGAAIVNGGGMMHDGFGFMAERLGIEGLQKIVARLDDDACRALIARLTEIDVRREPAENSLARERFYYGQAYPWKHRSNVVACALFPELKDVNERLIEAAGCEKRARLRLLVAHLALRRFWLATNRHPDSLYALVPRYLASVPLDPFADRALTYKKLPAGYLLYSIGDDRIDDSGAPSSPFTLPVPKGDIVVAVDLPPVAGDSPDEISLEAGRK